MVYLGLNWKGWLFYRVWCGVHQLDLAAKELVKSIDHGAYSEMLSKVVTHLRYFFSTPYIFTFFRNKPTFVQATSSRCPRRTTRWTNTATVMKIVFLSHWLVRYWIGWTLEFVSVESISVRQTWSCPRHSLSLPRLCGGCKGSSWGKLWYQIVTESPFRIIFVTLYRLRITNVTSYQLRTKYATL